MPLADLLFIILPVIAFFIFASWVILTGKPAPVAEPVERDRPAKE